MKLKIPILLYHSIAEYAAGPFRQWVVSPAVFAAQMAYLDQRGYTPLTVSQLVQARPNPPARPVVITFDDGFADFYTNALPVLQCYDFAATLFITTAFVGNSSGWLHRADARPMLTWPQIGTIRAAGVEIGAHSHTHPQLDTLPVAAAGEEIRRSKLILEQHLGCPVVTFAYPHGYYSPAVRRLVQQAGYTSACAVKHAISSTADDRFALARIIVAGDTEMGGFSQLLAGTGLWLAPFPERLPTKGWRLFRRTVALVKHYQIGLMN